MKEFIEKLIGRLEELKTFKLNLADAMSELMKKDRIDNYISKEEVIEIVNQLAEEYNNEAVKGDLISKKAVITELNGIYLDNPWDNKEDILEKAIGIVDHFPTAYNNGWIPFTQRELTEEEKEHYGEDIKYMLDCELPEEDEEILVTYKFKDKFYVEHDIFFKDGSMCYLDSGRELIDEAIAWQPLPEPYQPKGE